MLIVSTLVTLEIFILKAGEKTFVASHVYHSPVERYLLHPFEMKFLLKILYGRIHTSHISEYQLVAILREVPHQKRYGYLLYHSFQSFGY